MKVGAENAFYLHFISWGELLSKTGTLEQPFRYAGYYYDNETELYYLKARYYNPDTARFLTKDTVDGVNANPQTLNLYAYCGGNPAMRVDPDGNTALVVVGVVVLGGGLAVMSATPQSRQALTDLKNESCAYIRDAYGRAQALLAEHTKNKRPSTWDTHTKKRPGAPEKGDERRDEPRKRPPGHKGPWPVKKQPEAVKKAKPIVKKK